MKFYTAPLVVLLLASPLAAEEAENELSPMERGAKLFLEGLLEEMAPAIKEFEGLADEFGPGIRSFVEGMGPALGELMEEVQDWSVYDAPEILPNGDIIIRRKPDAQPLTPLAPQVEL